MTSECAQAKRPDESLISTQPRFVRLPVTSNSLAAPKVFKILSELMALGSERILELAATIAIQLLVDLVFSPVQLPVKFLKFGDIFVNKAATLPTNNMPINKGKGSGLLDSWGIYC